MAIYGTIVGVVWVCFIVYWFISALGAKRSVLGRGWGPNIGFRLVVMLILFFLIRNVSFDAFYNAYFRGYVFSPSYEILGACGVVLCLLGLACAVWARMSLGTNWGMPMTQREHTELVVRGPYAYVRHPIYSALLLMMVGTALVVGIAWLLVVVVFFPYFIYSAKKEEQFMGGQFPNDYPAYMARTKMFIPIVF